MSDFIEKEIVRLQNKYGLVFVKPNTILISYPKSGRTWLRMMLAKLMNETYNKANNEKYEIFPALHDSYKQIKERFKKDYKNLNIVFLHRHPADVAISHYKELTTSGLSGLNDYDGTISDFIRSKVYGINKIIEYNNKWAEKGGNFNRFLIMSYYMLHNDPATCLSAIAQIIEIPATKEYIESSIEYGSFENMKKIENGVGENLLKNYKGNFGHGPGRVRVGKYNNYHNVLSKEDIEYVEECMKNSLITYIYDDDNKENDDL
tara:strand:- start:20396 stop:21181 length:786 start_codon:yes stop_codon:yes gene_type:complete